MKKSTILEIVATLVLAALVFTAVHTTIESRVVEGSSMETTLHDGERLIVLKAAYWFGEPQRGDVIIFQHPEDPGRTLVKRIIGLPGEHIEVVDGIVYINGSSINEPYINTHTGTDCGGTYCNYTVPAGEYYVMGDNRNPGMSSDSRYWGPILEGSIIGKVWLLYWPLSDWHLVRGFSYTY